MDRLIIGCGYLGSRVASLWKTEGPVYALTRSRGDALSKAGLVPIPGDVTDSSTLKQLGRPWHSVLYAVGMDRSAGKSFREVYVNGLRNVLDALGPVERFIYISSTSVYGQTDGSQVDEDSPTEPIEENGKILLEAEALVRERLPQASILRFAGIYGPDRLLRRGALERGEPLTGDADKFLNLIHVEDGARAVLAAEEKGAGGLYCISDGQPVRRRDFYTELAELLGAPPARFEPHPGEPPAHDRANRRVANGRAKRELGWSPKFADCGCGLRHAVKSSA